MGRLGDSDVSLIEQTLDWNPYEEDSSKYYKDVQVQFKTEVTSANVMASNAKGCMLINADGQNVTTVKNFDRFKVIIPKNIDQIFELQADYTLVQPVLYMGKGSSSQTSYLTVTLENKNKKYRLQLQNQAWIDVFIHNHIQGANTPIQGNGFKILDENQNDYSNLLSTDENGIIQTSLKKGKYYLQQMTTSEGELQKELIPIQVKGTEQVIHLTIYNTKIQQQQEMTNEKEVNVTEENKVITQNHVKDIMNIHTTNVQTEKVNQTNETNLENINHFVNTIHKKNILNLTRQNYYNNEIWEQDEKSQELQGEHIQLQKNKPEYNQYIDLIKVGTIDIPNLPVASNE